VLDDAPTAQALKVRAGEGDPAPGGRPAQRDRIDSEEASGVHAAVKDHFKRVFAKTRTSGRAELVARVAGGSVSDMRR
jgi:hypothetical protein